MNRRLLLLALAALPALAACGRKGDLEPPPKKESEERPTTRRSGS